MLVHAVVFVFTIEATAFLIAIRQQHKLDDFKFSHFDVCYDAVLFTAKTSQFAGQTSTC